MKVPPKYFLRFLRWFCCEEYLDEIEGDLTEVFIKQSETSPRKAKWNFGWSVIKYFRPEFIKSFKQHQPNRYGMYKSYFKIGWRSLLKSKGYSFINMSGLALGIACFLFLISYVRYERSYENFHSNADNIYRVTLDLYQGEEFLVTDCETYAPFGPLAKEKMPEVIDFVRLMNNDNTRVKIGEQKYLEERSYFADSSVFTVFSFKALHGTLQGALSKPHQVVITASTAKKYFGETDVVNQTIEARGGLYKITAVIEDVPANTHLKFNFLLSHVTYPKIENHYTDQSWESGNNEYTYLLMAPGTDIIAFNKKLTDLSASLKDKINEDRFSAEPIKDIHLYSNKTYEPEANGNARTVYALLLIAIFIMGLAWVNYINLSTARAIERAREVGVRKVMGSARSQLVTQFLTESIIVNVIAALMALGIVKIGLPFFCELTGQPLMDIFQHNSFWYSLVAILVVGVVFSGGYPAIVLSSFDPVSVLKGKFRSSGHGQWLRQGLVVFQFAATTILIICLGAVYLQIKHLQNYDLGMDINQTLILRAPDKDQADSIFQSKYESFKTELLRDPSIQVVSNSQSIPGSGSVAGLIEMSTTQSVFQVGKDKNGSSFNYSHYPIDADFIPAFSMELSAGRNFEAGMENQNYVIINEEASKSLGFLSPQEAVGSKITYRIWPSDHSIIIGVVKDFHQRSPKENHIPMIFRYYPGLSGYVTLKVKTNNMEKTIDYAKRNWDNLFPSSPFSYFFLNEKYNQQYKADAQFGVVMATFSVIAIVIACLGLFGLSSFTILQRTKEIGIRKVLGGSVTQIVQLLSRDFIKWVLVASILAIPLSFIIIGQWLSTYAVRIDLSAWIFIVPLVIIVLISILTVSIQTIKAANANPVNSLKTE
ncbi:MAG: ABC transporter permease [Cyclobacteriaceae bacterium]|nr:ABC transporter permease [Cyclobacteriaceae bacterium]